jgi:AraC family transcriptional regulator
MCSELRTAKGECRQRARFRFLSRRRATGLRRSVSFMQARDVCGHLEGRLLVSEILFIFVGKTFRRSGWPWIATRANVEALPRLPWRLPSEPPPQRFPGMRLGRCWPTTPLSRGRGFTRRYRFPRVVDRFLVPATPEPLISCGLAGSAEFREREIGEAWVTRQIRRGDIFVTRSKTPYEVRFSSSVGEELEIIQVHVAVDQWLASLEAVYPGKADQVEVIDFFGRDEALAHLCFACAEMLSEGTPGKSKRVADLTQLLASFLVEKYTDAASEKPDFRGGLPIRQLRKVEDYVRDLLAEDISVEALAELVDLSPFHFSRVFKHATGMSPLQFVTRERITRAQQLIRETSRSPHRDCARSQLHEPKLLQQSFSAHYGRDAHRVP